MSPMPVLRPAGGFDLPAGMRIIERDWLSSNSVLFTSAPGENRVQTHAIVDTGYIKHAPLLLEVVRGVLGKDPLHLIVNTHLHSDHCGGNALLQRLYGCRTLIPAGTAQAVRDWDEERLSYQATQQRCDRFRFDDVLCDGDQLRLGNLDWEVIGAPGHDPDSVVLYCADEGLLISADALWENGFGVIFPELEGASGFAEQGEILDRMAGLDVRLVVPGHGRPFTDFGAAIERARRRLDALASDPVKHARHAAKVLIKFLLLDRERIAEEDVARLLESARLTRIIHDRWFQSGYAELAQQLCEELAQAGAARRDRGWLLDA